MNANLVWPDDDSDDNDKYFDAGYRTWNQCGYMGHRKDKQPSVAKRVSVFFCQLVPILFALTRIFFMELLYWLNLQFKVSPILDFQRLPSDWKEKQLQSRSFLLPQRFSLSVDTNISSFSLKKSKRKFFWTKTCYFVIESQSHVRIVYCKPCCYIIKW